jgi:hypothetical protein
VDLGLELWRQFVDCQLIAATEFACQAGPRQMILGVCPLVSVYTNS